MIGNNPKGDGFFGITEVVFFMGDFFYYFNSVCKYIRIVIAFFMSALLSPGFGSFIFFTI